MSESRRFIRNIADFKVSTTWRTRVSIAWQILRGRTVYDIVDYQSHVHGCDAHNHDLLVSRLREVDTLHEGLGEWAGRARSKGLRAVAKDIDMIYNWWNTCGGQLPWESDV